MQLKHFPVILNSFKLCRSEFCPSCPVYHCYCHVLLTLISSWLTCSESDCWACVRDVRAYVRALFLDICLVSFCIEITMLFSFFRRERAIWTDLDYRPMWWNSYHSCRCLVRKRRLLNLTFSFLITCVALYLSIPVYYLDDAKTYRSGPSVIEYVCTILVCYFIGRPDLYLSLLKQKLALTVNLIYSSENCAHGSYLLYLTSDSKSTNYWFHWSILDGPWIFQWRGPFYQPGGAACNPYRGSSPECQMFVLFQYTQTILQFLHFCLSFWQWALFGHQRCSSTW